jgi:hypothetical protein
MTQIDRMAEVQAGWDRVAAGDVSSALDGLTPDLQMWHGPGAGPFAGYSEGIDRLIEMSAFFDQAFAGTWHQAGRCVYADDACTVSLVHETGTAPDGVSFDNRALWISRLDSEGKANAMWTVDLDAEQVRAFWAARGVTTS